MRQRLRKLEPPRVSFFAFQDIITSCSGILILVTLILASDLGETKQSEPSSQEFTETLRRQREIDLENARLQNLLISAETAPSVEKLQTDISELQQTLRTVTVARASLSNELATVEAQVDDRDRQLGLSDVKKEISRARDEADEVRVRVQAAAADVEQAREQLSRAEALLAKARARENQLWVTHDRGSNSKKPLFVTVSRAGLSIERYNSPSDRKTFRHTQAATEFETVLAGANPSQDYVLFLVRPSGIGLFNDVESAARKKGFEIGFDAIDEGQEVHFSAPPPLESGSDSPAEAPAAKESEPSAPKFDANPSPPPEKPKTDATAEAAVPKRSWWQRLLSLVGLG